MIEPRGGADFPDESLRPEARGQLRLQHFHRDRPVVAEVVGKIHRGHAAPAQLALDGVAAG
jgi:hypothetical protein